MKIYTKTGDTGETSLFGGQRVEKDNLRVTAYGTVDELNAHLGAALAEIQNQEIRIYLTRIQNELFSLGSDLATPFENEKTGSIARITNDPVFFLEKSIDEVSNKLDPLRSFILPGGTKGASALHIARTVCRRSERLTVTLKKQEKINEKIIVYLNRLSDFLFVLARYENFVSGVPDVIWSSDGNI